MRVLVAGAGIAGLPLAALLRRQDAEVVLIERSKDFRYAGYGVGIYPPGLHVLYDLGLRDAFGRHGTEYRSYALHDSSGAVREQLEMTRLFAPFDPAIGITRPDLIGVLQSAAGVPEVRFGTAVTALHDTGSAVVVTLSDGTTDTFDLVVGADGAHSSIRALAFAAGETGEFDTGWVSLYVLGESAADGEAAISEFYGSDHMIGIYPMKECSLYCFAAPKQSADRMTGPAVAAFLRTRWPSSIAAVEYMAGALEGTGSPYFSEIRDYRCARWVNGRVALAGDAACSFLPTAGFGSTMALAGAAALTDEVSRIRTSELAGALARYEARQKPRTENAQELSRKLGRTMFAAPRPPSASYSTAQFAKDAVAMMREWL